MFVILPEMHTLEKNALKLNHFVDESRSYEATLLNTLYFCKFEIDIHYNVLKVQNI